MFDHTIYLRLEFVINDQRIAQSLCTKGEIDDPNVEHALHFQLDALLRGLRSTVKDLT